MLESKSFHVRFTESKEVFKEIFQRPVEEAFTIPDFVKEADLREMLRFIKGEGKYKNFGQGIHTYPDTIHQELCLKLEKRGLIFRKVNELDHIFWLPVKAEV